MLETLLLLIAPAVSLQEPEETRPGNPPPKRTGGYSFDAGVAALVKVKQDWRIERKCVSCHTNGWGLAAQPVIAPKSKEVAEGRIFAQEYLQKYLSGEVKPKGQHGSTEGVVATAAFLAMSDARSGLGLHEVTRQALNRAWDLLDESGTWEDWLQCNWPPFESDAEFGPTLVLVALGELRENTRLPTRDLVSVKKLSRYLRENPPLSLHAKAMRLWADTYWPNIMRNNERKAWRQELVSAQAEDGGWSMASLSGPAWKRDGGEGQTTTSEAYPTAFSTYVLLKTGTTPNAAIIRDGLRWTRKNQREDGGWFTRSPRRDRKHYISRAATSFSLMALAEGASKERIKLDSAAAEFLVRKHAFKVKPQLNPKTEFQIEEFQIKGLWDEIGIQLIASAYLVEGQQFNESLHIIHDGSLSSFGSAFGGFGLMSAVLLDGDLYYSYSWGSGVHRSVMGRISLDEKGQLQVVETENFLSTDLFLRSVNGRIQVETGGYDAFNSWQDGQPIGWLEYKKRRLILTDETGMKISPKLFTETQR